MATTLPEIDEIARWLSYDPETGEIRWLRSRGGMIAGSKAGCVHQMHGGRCQYLMIGFGYRQYMAHALAWALINRSFPSCDIDHKNGNSLDNRLRNLRLATKRQNSQNAKKRLDNSSGHKGVSWCKCTDKWVARIRSPAGKYLNLGRYSSLPDAREAYDVAATRLFGEFKRAA